MGAGASEPRQGGAASRRRRVVTSGDEGFLAAAIPFVTDGIAAGDPVLVVLGARREELLQQKIDDPEPITFIPASHDIQRPSSRIASLRRSFAVHSASGAERIRLVEDLPPSPSGSWQPWLRYEAFALRAFAAYPLVDLSIVASEDVPRSVIDKLTRVAVHGETAELLDEPVPPVDAPPAIHLEHPAPTEARRRIADMAARLALPIDRQEHIVAAVSEIVTNALVHGAPPMELCAWAVGGGIEGTVTDHGGGPSDPTVGLAPADRVPGEGGLGLFIAHQLCDEVTLHRRGMEFTVRLVICRPPGA